MESALSAHRTRPSRLRAVVLSVAAVTAVSVTGPGTVARAEPVPPGAAEPEAAPPADPGTAAPELPAELAEVPTDEPPPDDDRETVAAVVLEDGQPTVVTVEAAPSDVAEVRDDLAEQPGVVDVFVDAPARAAAVARPDDPGLEWQWAYDGLHRDGIGWDGVSAGDTETVAVLDTGVDATHPDLAGRVLCGQGADFTVIPDDGPIVSTGNGCTDPLGHGTHVAGIVGAEWDNGVGVAGTSRARILPVRVLDDQGWGTVAGVSAGIIHAVDAGARVINMSIVGDGPAGRSGYEEAVRYALDHDVVVVASAGNNRQEGNLPQYPAAIPGVFSVAATDDLSLSAPYSYRGPQNFISAPGTDIYSTVPGGGYDWSSGTSMAAPHVAGIVAWYRDLHATATVDDIRALIQSTAIDLEQPGRDDSTGYGMIDFAELVTGVQQAEEYPYRSTVPAAPMVTSVVPRDSGLLVTWKPPTWSGGATVQRYGVHVWRYLSGEYTYVTTAEAAGTAKGMIVRGLVNGRSYVVVAFAYGRYMAEGQWSVETPPTRVVVPRILTPYAGPGSARVRWSAPSSADGLPVAGYRVDAYRGATKVATVTTSTSAREVRIRGLVNGRAHTFVVWAKNASGTGVPSKRSVAVTPRATPGAPRIGRPAAADDAARVYWAAPSDDGGATISAYVIKVYQGTRGITSVTVPGRTRSVLVRGLRNDASYTFTATAKNGLGLGPASVRSPAVRTR